MCVCVCEGGEEGVKESNKKTSISIYIQAREEKEKDNRKNKVLN